jgi:hypothetical protein
MDPAIDRLREAVDGIRHVPGSTWELYSARLFDVFCTRIRGDAIELRRAYDQHLADAALRGDQYLDSTMRRACVPMWLAEDDPDAAAMDLEHATWVPDEIAFHVQHYLELIARADISMYRGGAPDARIAPMLARLEASLLRRIATIAVQVDYARGRLALAAGDRRTAAAAARALGRHPNLNGQAWALVLHGGLDHDRDPDAATRWFERADAAAAAAGMRLTSAVSRWRLAVLRGEPVASARADLIALGCKQPDRMVDTYAPCLRKPRSS